MTTMTGGQALIRSLISEGLDTVFALPGIQMMRAFDALYDHRNLNVIVPRHEQAATYMADGYARVTGRPGVAMVVPGPGLLNALSGLGTAYACSSPVLLISGQIPSSALGKRMGLLHEVDNQIDVARDLTKWRRQVLMVEEIPGAVHEAMRQLKTGRPRPVLLEVPPDVLAAAGNVDLMEAEEYPVAQPPDPRKIAEAAGILLSARNPIVLSGGGAISSGASGELLEVAEFLQALIVTTPEGKGIVPEDSYLCMGGASVGLGPMKHVIPNADVILGVGTRLVLTGMKIQPSQRVVHIDVDLSEIGKAWPTAVGIAADARPALAALAAELKARASPRPSRRAELEKTRSAIQQELKSLGAESIEIIETLRSELEDDAVYVSGMTCVGYWDRLAYEVRTPRSYITSGYFGTLGYAFPTALGAKVAAPDRQVVAVSGDGGFMFNAQELSTAVKHGINTVTVVFRNDLYGASAYDQKNQYRGRYIGTDLHNPDFVRLAESFGAVGMRAEDHGELGPLLRKALQMNRPVVLEVVVPNMLPPFEVPGNPIH